MAKRKSKKVEDIVVVDAIEVAADAPTVESFDEVVEVKEVVKEISEAEAIKIELRDIQASLNNRDYKTRTPLLRRQQELQIKLRNL